jgi:protein O-GlcNAc transferase
LEQELTPDRTMRLRGRVFLLMFMGGAVALTGRAAGAPDLAPAVELYQTHHYDEARNQFEQLRAQAPDNADIAFYLGLIARQQKRWDDAIRYFEEGTRLAPSAAATWIELGTACGIKANEEGSLAWAAKSAAALEHAVDLAPASYEARAALAQFYRLAPALAGGGLPKAYAQAEALRKLDLSAGTRLLSSLLVREKRYSEVSDACEQVLSVRPDDYAALYYLGHAASLSGQHTEAGRLALIKCLALPAPTGLPGPSTLWCRIAQIEVKVGDLRQARIAYGQALSVDPNNREAIDGLARL